MNINCFQYKKLKNCKTFKIIGNLIVGGVKSGCAIVVPITENQFKQDHDTLVYGSKWRLTR